MKATRSVLFLVTGFLVCPVLSFAQPSASQTAGGVSLQEETIEKTRSLRSLIESRASAQKKSEPEAIVVADSGPKVLIKKITVEGAEAVAYADVQKIVAQYEGTEISLKQAQKVADRITDLYRQKGLMTSRAYVPPQSLKEGNLLIKVIEGRVGSIEVRGNRFFSTSLLKDRLSMPPGGYFDYSALQRSLVYINEHPDRNVKASILPGKTPGTTDVIVDVKDQLPIHAGFEFDNFASRYIDKERYSTILEHNNLTGHDDKLYYKFQTTEGGYMHMQQGRYVYPVLTSLDLGGYFIDSKLKLGREFEDLESRGKARIYGVFMNKALLQKTDLDIRYTLGFDYKNIVNFLSGNKTSRDNLRILKNGVDVDYSDNYGRNILGLEYDAGFPDIMGGMDAKDAMASRAGSGARFQKEMLTYYRLHPTPFSTSLLWKNSVQFSNHTLPASEQFQAGGAASVRGYAPAEAAGDSGYYTALELSFPLYGLSKDVKVPFRKEKLWDAFRFVTFWDFATTKVKNTTPGEKDTTTLKGYGVGARFNVLNLTARVELGYPIGKTSADGNRPHPWVEFTYKF
ncbi:MAG: ShlB/FhaC/HecB family hemolysin secretion/activation protein [Candidatus Omnitrophica bacterium]|nr:ShlB/FhaC/HecB family hemolysin secretion/activation protein [Candidatus Omnitrophota bacterium]